MNDVDVESLKSSLNSLKESLDTSTEEEILKNIQDKQLLQTDAANVLIQAVTTLLKKHEDLKKKIDSYISVANMMKEYQNLDARVDDLYDDISEEENLEEPDYSYIRSLRNEIRSCQKEMNELKNTIAESI